MPTEKKPAKHEPDWAAIDALSDADIERQIAANPDAAPDMGDVPLEHWTAYQPLDVKAIRRKSGMTQEQFAKTYELSLGALRDWEQQRRLPHGPARVLLKVIDREPEAVSRALAAAPGPSVGQGSTMVIGHAASTSMGHSDTMVIGHAASTSMGHSDTMASGYLIAMSVNTTGTVFHPQLPPERDITADTPRRKRS